jgi:hypothetical protein
MTVERGHGKKHAGRFALNFPYLGGEQAGKHENVLRNKAPFVVAIVMTQDDKPMHLQLRRIRSCSMGESVQSSCFKWVNTMLVNGKNTLLGSFHAIYRYARARFLAESDYQINRRLELAATIERLILPHFISTYLISTLANS